MNSNFFKQVKLQPLLQLKRSQSLQAFKNTLRKFNSSIMWTFMGKQRITEQNVLLKRLDRNLKFALNRFVLASMFDAAQFKLTFSNFISLFWIFMIWSLVIHDIQSNYSFGKKEIHILNTTFAPKFSYRAKKRASSYPEILLAFLQFSRISFMSHFWRTFNEKYRGVAAPLVAHLVSSRLSKAHVFIDHFACVGWIHRV